MPESLDEFEGFRESLRAAIYGAFRLPRIEVQEIVRESVRRIDDALQLVPYRCPDNPRAYVVCAYGHLTRVSESYATLVDNTGRAIFEEHYHDAQGTCLARATRKTLPEPR